MPGLTGAKMLRGEAKRDYMRRKRAGEPIAKPKPEWQPTQSMIDEVHYWFSVKLGRRPWELRGIGRQVVDDLMPNNDDGTPNEASWEEAMRRYKALRDQQRANRKRAKAERDAPPPPECCSFCGEPKSANRAR